MKAHRTICSYSRSPKNQPTIKRLRILGIEIFKTLTDLIRIFWHIFQYSCNSTYNKHNLQLFDRNTSRYRNKSLRILGAHIWKCFLKDIKFATSIYKFKEFIKGWYRCKCYLCFIRLVTYLHYIHIFWNLCNTPNNIFTCQFSIHILVNVWIFYFWEGVAG